MAAYYSCPAVADAIMHLRNAEFPAFRQAVLFRAVQTITSIKNDPGMMQVAQIMATVYSNILTQVHGGIHLPLLFSQ